MQKTKKEGRRDTIGILCKLNRQYGNQNKKELFEFVDTKYPEIFATIKETKQIDEALEETIVKAITECKAEFMK